MGSKQNKKKCKINIKEENKKYEKKEIYKYNILFDGSAGIGTKTSLAKKNYGR